MRRGKGWEEGRRNASLRSCLARMNPPNENQGLRPLCIPWNELTSPSGSGCHRPPHFFQLPWNTFPNLSNGVTVKTEEYHVAEVSPKNAEDGKGELGDSEEGKEGKSTPKPDKEEEDLWAPFTVGVKVEREDIDPSRYVIVVENQKKSGERVEGGMKSKKSIAEGGKKRERRRQGGRKKRTRRSFTCDICREVLDNEEELEGHRKSKHINEKSEFFCDFCLKVFKTKAILKGHRYKHVTDPQFLCVRCGKKYFTISNLNEHSLYCLDEKKFECPVCYKKFNVNKQFKRHLVIHEADRYIKCTVCEQTFSRKDNYRQHFRRHTGEKPYTCDICGKSFRIKATYNYHRRTHRDVRGNDVELHKSDASEAEFGVLRGRPKEAGDVFFHSVPENSNFGILRDGTDYGYGREDSATFPETRSEKESNREGQQFLERMASDFPESFLRKEGYQERGLSDPYGRLPQTE